MKIMSHRCCGRLAALFLAVSLLVSAFPVLGQTASAVGMKGAYFVSGSPPFAYVVTGIRIEDGDNTVKLYQNADMQSYEGYTGTYTIPERVYDKDDMCFYTVTEIGGSVGTSIPGALENVSLRGIDLPGTVTTVGARAFANCVNLLEMSFPTSVAKLGADAFLGVNLQKLTLKVSNRAAMPSDRTYIPGDRLTSLMLPHEVTDLEVSAPLSITGRISIPGGTEISNSSITVDPNASLELQGSLSGTGVIEVTDGASLTLWNAAGYSGVIRLAGPSAEFTNRSALPVPVANAVGRTVNVQPNETLQGGSVEGPPVIDPAQWPQITTNYGGSVSVLAAGKVVEITAFNGYHVEEVVINGLSMGDVTRYEFEQASALNTVSVTFAVGNGQEGPVPPVTFTDVPGDASYAKDVRFLASSGIFQGMESGRFGPDLKTSRAFLLFLFKRLEIYDEDFQVVCKEPENPFVDVAEGAWYSDAAVWAAGTGIWEKGTFLRPDQPITREEAALCLYRYNFARGYGAYLEAGRYHAYRDSLLLDYESRQAMTWAATYGYLRTNQRRLDPAGTMTRAELVQMLARYLRRT